MDLFLQIWGGSFYLLNKIFFATAEGKPEAVKRRMKLTGWVVYILGVPAWVIILISKNNFITAAIETGGVPSMFLGLLTVYYSDRPVNKALDRFASLSMYLFIIVGMSYSLYEYGGLTAFTQFLELGTVVGFLAGSYLLAKDNRNGWLFFMLMNSCVAVLMFVQDKNLLCIQQILSLCFVVFGYTKSARK